MPSLTRVLGESSISGLAQSQIELRTTERVLLGTKREARKQTEQNRHFNGTKQDSVLICFTQNTSCQGSALQVEVRGQSVRKGVEWGLKYRAESVTNTQISHNVGLQEPQNEHV